MLVSEFINYKILLSSSLNIITINQGADTSLKAELFCDDELQVCISYIPTGDTVELSGIDDIIEEYCRGKGKSVISLKIVVAGKTYTASVLYCPFDYKKTDASELIADRFFFTSCDSKFSSFATTELLSFIGEGSVSVELYSSDNLMETKQLFPYYSGGVSTVSVNLKELCKRDFNNLTYVLIKKDARCMELFKVQEPPIMTLYFRNRYNAWETIEIFGESKKKEVPSVSTAQVNRKTVAYDRRRKQSFDVSAIPLSVSSGEILSDLINSHDVRLCGPDTIEECPQIVITDASFEQPFPDVTDAVAKFTFEFAQSTPSSDILGKHRIFNSIFAPQFS